MISVKDLDIFIRTFRALAHSRTISHPIYNDKMHVFDDSHIPQLSQHFQILSITHPTQHFYLVQTFFAKYINSIERWIFMDVGRLFHRKVDESEQNMIARSIGKSSLAHSRTFSRTICASVFINQIRISSHEITHSVRSRTFLAHPAPHI